jgi:hypothetical protein
VTADGKHLVSNAGSALLAELADRSGLTRAMSEAMAGCGISWHTHDSGVVLTRLAVAMADGADCLSDFAALKEQEELFGPVASVPTAWRAVQATCAGELRAIPRALARAREVIWAQRPPDEIVIDIDATLVTALRKRRTPPRPTRAGSASTPSGPGATPRPNLWRRSCRRATPWPTTSTTTWSSWMRRSPHALRLAGRTRPR